MNKFSNEAPKPIVLPVEYLRGELMFAAESIENWLHDTRDVVTDEQRNELALMLEEHIIRCGNTRRLLREYLAGNRGYKGTSGG